MTVLCILFSCTMTITQRISEIQLASESLQLLKGQWANEINSTRKLDQIQSVADLVDILWKQDIIGLNNIDILFSTRFRLFDQRELEICREYIRQLDAVYSDVPLERTIESSESSQETGEAKGQKKSGYPNLSPRNRQFYRNKIDIFNLIAQDLGMKKFMTLARQRGMKISASELENVRFRYPDVESQIHHVLELGSERNERHEFPDVLLDSLDKAGRLDLKRQIENTYLC